MFHVCKGGDNLHDLGTICVSAPMARHKDFGVNRLADDAKMGGHVD